MAALIARNLDAWAVSLQVNLELLFRHLPRGARRYHASLLLWRIEAFQWTLVYAVLRALIVKMVYQLTVFVQFSRLFLLSLGRL